jgi:hypothetical protein
MEKLKRKYLIKRIRRIKMKAKLFSVIIVVLLITIVGTIKLNVASDSPSCKPQIKLVGQDPVPATPNSYLKLVFEVSNLGGIDCQEGLAIKLNQAYPFSLDPGINEFQTLSARPYASGYNTVWTVPYTVKIASDTINGEYNLTLFYHTGNSEVFGDSYSIASFNITIKDTQTDFSTIVQETSGTQVSIGIVNIGENTANALIVGIPQQDNYETSGVSEQIVGNLAAGDYTIVSFTLTQKNLKDPTKINGTRPSGTATVGQPLKIKISYTDGIGKRRSVINELQLTTTPSSNMTQMIPNGANFGKRNNSSSVLLWWILGIIVVVLAAGAFVYFKYFRKRKKSSEKHHQEKNSDVPEWVANEKNKIKK